MKPIALLLALLLLVTACSDPEDPDRESPATNGGAVSNETPAAGGGTAQGSGAAPPQTGGGQASAAPFDPNAVSVAVEQVASGFRAPVFVTHAGDGSGRLFVVEKGGLIRIIRDGQTLERPFLDVSGLVRATGSEQGLLGLAFHPRYRENGTFFIAYTASDAANTVARYQVSGDPDLADAGSARVLWALPDRAANHNGGMLAFGPDGYLYVGTGDEGGGNDQFGNAQDREALFGKMLRVDVDSGDPYAVPGDNPFVGQSGVRPEIWAYGLRNPWRYSFDRATGELYIADVGQNAYEEVNVQPADSRGGENYGWPRMEGMHCYRGDCDQSQYTLPVTEYGRDSGCSITGGYVYRGAAHPALQGAYFVSDYCSGRLWSLHRDGAGAWVTTEWPQTGLRVSSFGEDEAGEIYLTDLTSGGIHRVTATSR